MLLPVFLLIFNTHAMAFFSEMRRKFAQTSAAMARAKQTGTEHTSTERSRLKLVPPAMLIENRQKGRKYYLLNLEEADKIFEE